MGLAFSVLEFLAELGGMEEITTEGIAHGEDDSEKEEASGDWGDDESPKDEDDLEGGGEDKEDDRSAEDQGLAGIAAPPAGDGGIDDEEDKEGEGELAGEHPRGGNAMGGGDGLVEELEVREAEHFAIVEIDGEEEIDEERERAGGDGEGAEPESTGVEMGVDEADEGDKGHPSGGVEPAECGIKLGDGFGLHHEEFAGGDAGGAKGGEGKAESIGFWSIVKPGKELDGAEREASGGIGGPENRDPVHGIPLE